jgi:uncharacterized protein (DUF1810 family)
MCEPFDLGRFVIAQEANGSYTAARSEIHDGEKLSHWIWYVFPQIAGLGFSAMSRKYAITSLEEARAYLAHPILGPRLCEITSMANDHFAKGARAIFSNDDVKFHSCVTLFSLAAPEESVFRQSLDLFFDGELDHRTSAIVAAHVGDHDRSKSSTSQSDDLNADGSGEE